MNADKYITLAFLQEKKRRQELKRLIVRALDLNFKRESKAIVKRGRVYEAIASTLRQPNNNHFKKTVRSCLEELGIVAICRHKNFLFKNIAADDSEALLIHLRKLHLDMKHRAKTRRGYPEG